MAVAYDILTKLRGIEVNEPNNLSDIQLNINITEDGDKVVTYSGNLDWGSGDLRYNNDAYLLLQSVLQEGINGGNGVAEAIPVYMEANELGKKIVMLDAMANLWDSEFDEQHRKITTPIIQRGGADWIANNTKGVSFEYLKSLGEITNDDIILSPYIVEKQNQALERALCAITGLVLYTQIREQITQIQQIASDTASMSPWTAVAKIILRILYIALLLKTLIDTFIRFVNLMIQPVKYIAGMTVKRHFEILFNHFGFKFVSSIFDNDEKYLTIFTEKYSFPINQDYDNILGWIKPNKSKQNGFFKGTGFDFCQIFKQYYNAKFIVDQTNNIIYFERRDYIRSTASFAPPIVWETKRLNRADFIGNHKVSFLTDINDRHTIQEYTGVASQVNISLVAPTNPQASLLDKGKEIGIPFALFRIKTELSEVEKALKTIVKTIDASLNLLVFTVNLAIKTINAIIKLIKKILSVLSSIGLKLKVELNTIPELPKFNLADKIELRKGVFKMEDDIVYSPKIAYVKDTGNDFNNRQYKELRAEDIQENYHAIDFFTRGNQWIQGSGIAIPVTFSDISEILNTDEFNDGSQLVSMQWNLMAHTANIITRKPFTYLKGLKETKLVPDGS